MGLIKVVFFLQELAAGLWLGEFSSIIVGKTRAFSGNSPFFVTVLGFYVCVCMYKGSNLKCNMQVLGELTTF